VTGCAAATATLTVAVVEYYYYYYSIKFMHLYIVAFAKFRKWAVTFVMSVRSHATTRLPLDGFS